MSSTSKQRGRKEEWGNYAKHSTPGKQHKNQGVVPKRISYGAPMKLDAALTVRCLSKEPANPHIPITTHTPITYTGHNTSKHAGDPIQNEAHKRIEWRHDSTA